jgi:CubicO group peptidase (beta-lactamase class C family)
VGGFDPDRLDLALELQSLFHGTYAWAIVIIRNGWLVRESCTFTVLPATRFNVWSCTKSVSGTAWGLLFDDSREGRLAGGLRVDLDTPAYSLIPDGEPLTDPAKARITIGHLLTMTSGIPGEDHGMYNVTTPPGEGPFEHALGRCPSRYGRWADKLVAEPGTAWEYSDPAFAHLSLAFAHAAGREIDEVIQSRVFEPIGLINFSWVRLGGGRFLGPHTSPHTGLYLSARGLARLGYLALHRGNWSGQQLVPEWWMDLATKSSQELNPSYGYTWWANTHGTMWPGLPEDAFALAGYASNRCYVIPSLELVVARVGMGPPTWNEPGLIGGIVSALAGD